MQPSQVFNMKLPEIGINEWKLKLAASSILDKAHHELPTLCEATFLASGTLQQRQEQFLWTADMANLLLGSPHAILR